MIKAIIFDMDGVISDTNLLHTEIESEFLKNKFDINITPQGIIDEYGGSSTEAFFTAILKKNKILADIDKLVDEKWALIMTCLDKIKPIDGSLELIDNLKKSKLKMAVASTSSKKFIEKVLDTLKIKNKFDAIVSGYEVKNHKPAPDIFLKAAQLINIKPENCLVIEDGLPGMIGAKKAKMKVIALSSDDETYPADYIVSSLKWINLELLNSISSK